MNTVLVFKTDMNGAGCKQTVADALQRQFGSALYWTVDLEDCDRVLRVETRTIAAEAIIQTLREAGFRCDELV